MNPATGADVAAYLRLALLALLLAGLPLAWTLWRRRGGDAASRLAAVTALTLFLTFDLIVFGAFTRLADAGLGCPDWPGCYASATPLGARAEIHAAQAAEPGGPVTWGKAWIEMIHRYLAMTVGALILFIAAAAWAWRHRLPFSPWWPTATLAWVVVQGLFGRYTVTLKLYPAVVTAHLLGGLLLLALLARQHAAFAGAHRPPLVLSPGLRRGAVVVAALLAVQIALGGWVSTNYAVLACTGFPRCRGEWWPAMDWATGFTLLRGLGEPGAAGAVGLPALVAIQMAHRISAVVVTLAIGILAWRLYRAPAYADPVAPPSRARRRFAAGLTALVLLQWASGLANVVLGWPLVAALGHSAGAAALVLLVSLLLSRSASAPQQASRRSAPHGVATGGAAAGSAHAAS